MYPLCMMKYSILLHIMYKSANYSLQQKNNIIGHSSVPRISAVRNLDNILPSFECEIHLLSVYTCENVNTRAVQCAWWETKHVVEQGN